MRLAHPPWMDQLPKPLTHSPRARAAQPSHSLRFARGVLPLKGRRQDEHRELKLPAFEPRVDLRDEGSHDKMRGSRMRGLHAKRKSVGQHQNHGGHCDGSTEWKRSTIEDAGSRLPVRD